MSHDHAKKELEAGTPAELICATCPWDRLCVEPPAMSAQEIQAQIKVAEEKDNERDPLKTSMPAQTLMTIMALGGRDTSGRLCPVFALRLRGPDGRQVADGIRQQMRTWGESS